MAHLQGGNTALDLAKRARWNKAECVALLEAAMHKVNHSDPSYPTHTTNHTPPTTYSHFQSTTIEPTPHPTPPHFNQYPNPRMTLTTIIR